MNNESFKINAKIVAIAVDLNDGKTYALSLSHKELKLPTMNVTSDNVFAIGPKVWAFMKELVAINPADLIPQLISVGSENMPDCEKEENTVSIVYGFLIPHSPSLNDQVAWTEFDMSIMPNPHYNLLLEVIQRLQ